MTLPQATEFAVGLLDAYAEMKRNGDGEEPCLAELCITECRSRFKCHKDRDLKKRIKALALALENANAEATHNDWLWLFSRMLGCYRASGRIKAIPAKGVDFVVEAFHAIQDVIIDSRRNLPAKLQSKGQKLAGQAASRLGYVGLAPTKKWLLKSCFEPIGVTESSQPALLKAAFRVLAKLSTPLEQLAGEQGIKNADVNNLKVKDLVSVMDVMLLASNVWCAMHYNEFEGKNRVVREAGRAAGSVLTKKKMPTTRRAAGGTKR